MSSRKPIDVAALSKAGASRSPSWREILSPNRTLITAWFVIRPISSAASMERPVRACSSSSPTCSSIVFASSSAIVAMYLAVNSGCRIFLLDSQAGPSSRMPLPSRRCRGRQNIPSRT